jgi:hypothetical protein
MSGRDHQVTQCHIPRECNPQVHHCENLNTRKSDTLPQAGRTHYATDRSHPQSLFIWFSLTRIRFAVVIYFLQQWRHCLLKLIYSMCTRAKNWDQSKLNRKTKAERQNETEIEEQAVRNSTGGVTVILYPTFVTTLWQLPFSEAIPQQTAWEAGDRYKTSVVMWQDSGSV